MSNARSAAQQRRRQRERQSSQNPFMLARRPYHEPAERHCLGRMNVLCTACSALHWREEETADGTFGMCCNHGKVQLPQLPTPPQILRDLLLGSDEISREYRRNIVQLNKALAFTSVGVQTDRSVMDGRGPYVFRIHGALHHFSGPLIPRPGHMPTYAQLYIYDPSETTEACRVRLERNPNLLPTLLFLLQDMIDRNHYYAQFYRHASHIIESSANPPEYAVSLQPVPGISRRRYEMPSVDEVAALIPATSEHAEHRRDIVLHRHNRQLQQINECHPAYSPLHYVLLFPTGEHGWSDALPPMVNPDGDDGGRITQTRFTAFRLHQRPNEFPTILLSQRLAQHYIVDMWASAEQNRLTYIRYNQLQLRASLYSGLEDMVDEGDVNLNPNELGQRLILPSSFIGGDRNIKQNYQDGMTMARFNKTIDLFITMTANAHWPEIERELLPGQSIFDRPDLIVCVFRLKQKELLHDILNKEIFGPVAGHIYTIEFQKHGLPHMHLLLFLKPNYHVDTIEAIDATISASWPDPHQHPKLFETVKRCMVHGPCGTMNRSCVCMENGTCTKNFPKPFLDKTELNADGYPSYRRPQDGRVYNVGGYPVDNRWIVPYNPFLSAKYDCHINVECAASFATVKYAMKYVHKGPDRSSIMIHDADEVKRYLDGRYISVSEALWRIFQFPVHHQYPSVFRLQIHEPGQHLVIFNPNEDVHAVRERASHETTTLTAYFDANRVCGEKGAVARSLSYQEFPQHFTWKPNTKSWELRRRGFSIERMYFVPPTGGERFYLRLLLTVVRGATSFDELKSYDGTVYNTFRNACIARGLLESDGEWKECLRDACFLQPG